MFDDKLLSPRRRRRRCMKKKPAELRGKKLHLSRETLRQLDLGKDHYPKIAGGGGNGVSHNASYCPQSPACLTETP
jgi:hypothetical protein